MNPEGVVLRQLVNYNAKDLDAFAANYAEDVREYRPPAREPFQEGFAPCRAYYGDLRFVLPALHADVIDRMVVGSKVVDHERIIGNRETVLKASRSTRFATGSFATSGAIRMSRSIPAV